MIHQILRNVKQEILNRAMKKAVELGVFPEYIDEERYLENWSAMEQILEAAIGRWLISPQFKDYQFWESVWQILKEECQAGKDNIMFINTAGDFAEWRFQGALGFGGKIYQRRFRGEIENLFVSCYSEDLTPEREAMIKRANKRLAELVAKGEGE